MIIQVDEESLKTTARQIRNTVWQLETCMNRIEQLLDETGQDWQGEAELAYEDKILDIRKRYETILNFFQAYAQEIEKMAENYENLEMKYAQQINSL